MAIPLLEYASSSQNQRVEGFEVPGDEQPRMVQRILGRDVYSDREKIAWSIVLATEGLQGFINALIDSDEYIEAFGENTVPYQRRRILPQRAQGERPFARMARYDEYHLAQLPEPSISRSPRFWENSPRFDYHRWDWQKNPPKALGQTGAALSYVGGSLVALGLLATFLSFLGLVHL